MPIFSTELWRTQRSADNGSGVLPAIGWNRCTNVRVSDGTLQRLKAIRSADSLICERLAEAVEVSQQIAQFFISQGVHQLRRHQGICLWGKSCDFTARHTFH